MALGPKVCFWKISGGPVAPSTEVTLQKFIWFLQNTNSSLAENVALCAEARERIHQSVKSEAAASREYLYQQVWSNFVLADLLAMFASHRRICNELLSMAGCKKGIFWQRWLYSSPPIEGPGQAKITALGHISGCLEFQVSAGILYGWVAPQYQKKCCTRLGALQWNLALELQSTHMKKNYNHHNFFK